MAVQDDICPDTVGDALFRLSLADPLARLIPYEPVDVSVDYGSTETIGGPSLPLELIISGPKAERVERRLFLLTLPRLITFSAEAPGVHTILLREMAHNLWVGSLRVTIEGKGK